MLSRIYVDKAFISTTGFSIQHGLTCTSSADAEIRKAMIARARTRILLSDSSKINKSSFLTVCELKMIDTLITDWEITPQDLKMLSDAGLKVIVAEPPADVEQGIL